jgi:hypothetical protein
MVEYRVGSNRKDSGFPKKGLDGKPGNKKTFEMSEQVNTLKKAINEYQSKLSKTSQGRGIGVTKTKAGVRTQVVSSPEASTRSKPKFSETNDSKGLKN